MQSSGLAMRFSLRFNNDLTVNQYIELAQAAEQAGFDQFWVSNDLFLRSAPVILTAIAGATTRIQIGTCILNPYTINPAEIAMFAATLDEYSNGRFNLGIAAGAADFLDWVGLQHDKPRTSLLEVVDVLRCLFAGDTAEVDGHFLQWKSEAYLRFDAPRQVPIYIGAMSPNMLRAIGSHADGGLPLLFPPEHYQRAMPFIEEGATNAGREVSDVDVAACIWCSIAPTQAEAEAPLREKIAYYGHAMSPMILSQMGLAQADFADIEHKVMVENDIAGAAALVTDDMLQIGIVGTPNTLIERVASLVAMGANHISFGPPLGPDPLYAIKTIGDTLIPHFRS
jgi:5,10-methylenetetrahydromethanopterin reductase